MAKLVPPSTTKSPVRAALRGRAGLHPKSAFSRSYLIIRVTGHQRRVVCLRICVGLCYDWSGESGTLLHTSGQFLPTDVSFN